MNRQLSKLFVVLMLMLLLPALPTQQAQAVSPDIVISQVYGGGGNSGATWRNDFVELFNRGTSAVNVAGWSVQYAASTGVNWSKTDLAGTIQPGQYYLVQEAVGSGGTVNLPTPNATGTIAMSATAGKVALISNNTTITSGTSCPSANVVDFVGYGSGTTCAEGSPTGNLSNTTAALRGSNGAADTDNNNADFAIGTPNPRNTPSPDAVPFVSSTVPANNASNVPLNSNITITFSESVNVTAPWFTLSCSLSGVHSATFAGGPTVFTLEPDTDFVDGDTCTLTVLASQVTDQDSNGPPHTMTVDFTASFSTGDVCLAPYTHIYSIQGNGPAAAITGPVTTQGVVVGEYEGPSPSLRGFYLQDLTGDGDAATSDGIFVFNRHYRK